MSGCPAAAAGDRRRPLMARCAAAVAALALGACGPAPEPPAREVRPVRTISVEELPGGETVTLTGRIEAQEEVNLAFRVSQRMIERRANVGDRVEPGQLVARLESTTLDNAVQAALANLAAAQALAADARLDFERQRSLFERGVAPRARFESAQKARDASAARVDAAQAQLATAREQRSFSELLADSGGSVTAVGAEPGEVVAAGQMIVRVARKGGRDAVFDVPARVIEAALAPEVRRPFNWWLFLLVIVFFPLFGGIVYLIFWLLTSSATVFLHQEGDRVVEAGDTWLVRYQEATPGLLHRRAARDQGTRLPGGHVAQAGGLPRPAGGLGRVPALVLLAGRTEGASLRHDLDAEDPELPAPVLPPDRAVPGARARYAVAPRVGGGATPPC